MQRLAEATDQSFTWSSSAEALLKSSQVRLLGEWSIPRDRIARSLDALLDSLDFRCEKVGDGDISVIKIDVK
ncbi:hypothetical protein [Planctomycetes bacterium Poly30]|uniref:hypothetical protein n=1 Tax=Saltatorellus ferox TaxID=2528018 RepID=UPI0011A02913